MRHTTWMHAGEEVSVSRDLAEDIIALLDQMAARGETGDSRLRDVLNTARRLAELLEGVEQR